VLCRQGFLGAECFVRYGCYGRLPIHISRRRVGSLVLVVTRCLRMADEVQKSSIYIRPLVVWLGEMENKAYDVSADVRTRWDVVFAGAREMSCEHRWASKNEVNSFWECNVEELRRDGSDVHRKSGVPVLYGLMWEEVWELESQTRNAMGDNQPCVRRGLCPPKRRSRSGTQL